MEKNFVGKYVIVRSTNAGVFAGELKELEGQCVRMSNVRRIWYWKGAASISQLAKDGTSQPDECQFPAAVKKQIIFEVIEIIPCTSKAQKSIEDVKEWKQ